VLSQNESLGGAVYYSFYALNQQQRNDERVGRWRQTYFVMSGEYSPSVESDQQLLKRNKKKKKEGGVVTSRERTLEL